jgi:hypothetical protein
VGGLAFWVDISEGNQILKKSKSPRLCSQNWVILPVDLLAKSVFQNSIFDCDTSAI